MTATPPTDADVLAFAAGELSTDEADAMADYLAPAAPAAVTVAYYRAVSDLVRGDSSVPAPAALIARAKAIFPTAAPPPSLVDQLFGAARRVIAELTFETGGGAPALAGFRGAAGQRQMVFEAEGTVVDLQVEPEANTVQRWRVLGQVDPTPHDTSLVVGLAPVQNDLSAVAVTTDRYGGFHLSAAAGHYNIFVRVPDALLVLPNLVLG